MKITHVEAIYLRQPEVEVPVRQRPGRADRARRNRRRHHRHRRSGFQPDGRQRRYRRPVLAHHGLRPGAGGDRRRSVRNRAALAQDVPRQYLRRAARRGPPRHERHRHGAVGYQGQSAGAARVETAGRRLSQEHALLCQFVVRRHAGEDRRDGAPLSRPGIHRGEVRLGSHGPGREDRHRAGARGAQRAGRRGRTC